MIKYSSFIALGSQEVRAGKKDSLCLESEGLRGGKQTMIKDDGKSYL